MADRRRGGRGGASTLPADTTIYCIALVLIVIALFLIGVVMVYSASSVKAITEGDNAWSYMIKQILIGGAGAVIAALIVWRVPYHAWLGKINWITLAVVVVALIYVFFEGVTTLGATRWIDLKVTTIQPSEFAKISFVLMGIKFVAEYKTGVRNLKQTLIYCGVCVALPLIGMFITQSDFGTTLIIVVGLLACLLLSGMPMRYLLAGLGVLGVGGVAALMFWAYRSTRIQTWLNPWADPYGDGYQVIHSFYAFSEGGITGVGLGSSSEKYLYLPESESDFIYSILGEEFGLIGAVIILLLFVALLYVGLKIAFHAPDTFGALMAGSLTVMIVFQAFLNMGCCLGILPVTGKPLPFISSGGSSILSSFIIVGLILSVALGGQANEAVYQRRRNNFDVISAKNIPPYAGEMDYR